MSCSQTDKYWEDKVAWPPGHIVQESDKTKAQQVLEKGHFYTSLCRQVYIFKYPSGFPALPGSISFYLSCICGKPSSHINPSTVSHRCLPLNKMDWGKNFFYRCLLPLQALTVPQDQRTSQGSLNSLCCDKFRLSQQNGCVCSEAERSGSSQPNAMASPGQVGDQWGWKAAALQDDGGS